MWTPVLRGIDEQEEAIDGHPATEDSQGEDNPTDGHTGEVPKCDAPKRQGMTSNGLGQ